MCQRLYPMRFFVAKDQGMLVKGHPLMWHQVLPEWIKDSERSAKIDKDIKRHVKNLILTIQKLIIGIYT